MAKKKQKKTQRKLIDVDINSLNIIDKYCEMKGGSSKSFIEKITNELAYQIKRRYPTIHRYKKPEDSFEAKLNID